MYFCIIEARTLSRSFNQQKTKGRKKKKKKKEGEGEWEEEETAAGCRGQEERERC